MNLDISILFDSDIDEYLNRKIIENQNEDSILDIGVDLMDFSPEPKILVISEQILRFNGIFRIK